MSKRILYTTLCLYLACSFLLLESGDRIERVQARTAYRSAAESFTVHENKATHSFAQHVTFSLHVSAETEIERIYLFFRPASKDTTKQVAIDIDPGREIKTQHEHDPRYDPLPPFARVFFWWHIEDADGNEWITDRQYFTYTDTRFEWKRLDEVFQDNAGATYRIAVHWIDGHGDPIFGQTALDIAQTSLKQGNADLHVQLPEEINIYIYDNPRNLHAAMELSGRDWVGGQAHPELGAIITSIPFESVTGYEGQMKRYIPHEIAHLLIYHLVDGEKYKYVPEWLDEGLATDNELLPTTEYQTALAHAYEHGTLIPLENLCHPFPPDYQSALLSYAQSGSLVKFIREEYGAEGIRRLLQAYANGASCKIGVEQALGVSLSGLESAWRASLAAHPLRATFDQIGVWIALWLLSLLLAVPMIGKLRQHR
ncbi:MAG TPA: hypothetical protein ENN19_18290 [Chloroflexi bacterium]|nr:hypothetical protein [Chloroflexota bacterium]